MSLFPLFICCLILAFGLGVHLSPVFVGKKRIERFRINKKIEVAFESGTIIDVELQPHPSYFFIEHKGKAPTVTDL